MKSKSLRKTIAIAMSAATLLTSAVSLTAFAAEDTKPVQTASATDVTYIENHDYVDCANYYIDGANYRFLIKIPNNASLSSVAVKNVFTGEIKNLATDIDSSYESVTFKYSDSTSDCYLYSVYSYPGSPKYMWYEYGIKVYYDNGDNHYMATNTGYNSTTEGPGYILKR